MAASINGRQNGHYSYDQFSRNESTQQRHFLWWCSGAHQPLLVQSPSEQTKYAGLGGVLLATFALASISAGYALYSIFDQPALAIGFALVWGLIIFNFDRFLVSTMRKYGVSPRKQFLMALPRLALAILIGFTIARPLELKLFEKEIGVKIQENRHRQMMINDSLLERENAAKVLIAESERNRLTGRKLQLEDTLHQLRQAYLQEADGTGGSRQRGIENITRLKLNAYQAAFGQYSPELQQINQRLQYQDSTLNQAHADLEIKRRLFESGLSARTGFLEKNKALTDLSAEETSIFWANLLISMLIILIEISPVLSKLIMHVGPYDLALAKAELLDMARSEGDMRSHKAQVQDRQEALLHRRRQRSQTMMDQLQALQSKHINQDIEQWEQGKRSDPKGSTMGDLVKSIKQQYDYDDHEVL